MTSLPTWAVWAISLGTPLLAFVGVLIAQFITLRDSRELEHRSKREEVMRILRWAAELAVSDEDEAKARLGVAELGALMRSELLDESERDFVQAALEAAVRVPVAEVEQAGDDAEVVVTTDPADDGLADGGSAGEPAGAGSASAGGPAGAGSVSAGGPGGTGSAGRDPTGRDLAGGVRPNGDSPAGGPPAGTDGDISSDEEHKDQEGGR